MSYLVSHVVGRGRETFDATFSDPGLAAARALAHDYAEGFYSVVLKVGKVAATEIDRALILYAQIEPFGPESPMKKGAPVSHDVHGIGFVTEETEYARQILFRSGAKLLPTCRI